MKSLKFKSLRSSLILILILLVVAAVLLYNGVPTLINSLKGPTPLEEVDFDGDIEGLYVEGTLTFIYDWYCETVENEVETVSREYIIDGGDLYYMGMLAKGDDMDLAEDLMDACYDYMDGYDDGTAVYDAQYHVSGTIIKMPDDSLEFYHEYVEYDTLPEDEQEMFLPYYLVVGNVGKTDFGGGVAFMVLGGLALIGGLIFIIRALTGKEQKNIYKYINSCPDAETAKEKVERFIETVPETEKMRYNHEFIMGDNGGTTAFGETSKLIWAYQHTLTRKRGFVTVGKTYSVILVFTDGVRQTAHVNSEAAAQQHLEKLSVLCPRAIIGYSEMHDSLFRKNLPGFLDLRYNKPEVYETTYTAPTEPAYSEPVSPESTSVETEQSK